MDGIGGGEGSGDHGDGGGGGDGSGGYEGGGGAHGGGGGSWGTCRGRAGGKRGGGWQTVRATEMTCVQRCQVEEGELGARGRHDEDICELDDEIVQKTMRK